MSWVERAACLGYGQDLWFDERPIARAVARRVCQRCPVRIECAGYAVELVDRGLPIEGTWAGVTVKSWQRRAGVDQLRTVAHR